MKSMTPLIFVPIRPHSVIKYPRIITINNCNNHNKELHKHEEADSIHCGKRLAQADRNQHTLSQISVQNWVLKPSLNDFTESPASAVLSTNKTCTKEGEILCQTTSQQDREVHDSKG